MSCVLIHDKKLFAPTANKFYGKDTTTFAGATGAVEKSNKRMFVQVETTI
ncbi:hypothetical protein O0550_18440 [Brevibacillus halotolerans]|nr:MULTISPECIES: hypothetical protein [Brevibacillus]MCR8965155.1 hypothetical protein [Brevibacillus laterosporus]MCZ0837310.1 hypothetical protein [Brevibacillus halotolerans]